MTRWPNNITDTNTKRNNYNAVPVRLSVAFSDNDRSLDRVRTEHAQWDTKLGRLLVQAVEHWTIITFALVAVWLFLALSPSLTNQAQEGQSRDWMGGKLVSRSYQPSAREIGR